MARVCSRSARNYVLGRGLKVTAADPKVRAVIESFWNSPRNQPAFSSFQAQQKLIERLVVEGELFPVLHASKKDGDAAIRFVQPDEIKDIITTPGDDEWRVQYRRVWKEQTWDYGSKSWKEESQDKYYRAAGNADEDHDDMSDGGTDRSMLHFAINTLGKRGLPSFSRALPWVKVIKGFMEDRATLVLALATFAFRMIVKGNQAAVTRMRERWEDENVTDRYSNLTGANGGREWATGARTFFQNDQVQFEQLKVDSGSANAYTDGRMFIRQICSATGMFEHYLTGDPSVGNLASTTAMELPMLKLFEAWQQLIGDVYKAILQSVVWAAAKYGELQEVVDVEVVEFPGGKYEVLRPGSYVDEATGEKREVDLTVTVDFPPIIQRDIAGIVSALTSAMSSGAMGTTLADPRYREAVRMLLQALGAPNPDELVAKAEAMGQEQEQPPAAVSESLVEVLEELRVVIAEAFQPQEPAENAA